MESSNNKRREIITTLSVLIVIVVIVGIVVISSKKDDDDTPTKTATTTQSTTTQSSSAQTGNTSTYNDGSYNAKGSYESPGGTEAITISVTLKDGTVTDTSAKSGATDNTAKEYQQEFISAYKKLVVGKSIENISLSRVSGSSLTSQGFNEALDKIKSQAKV